MEAVMNGSHLANWSSARCCDGQSNDRNYPFLGGNLVQLSREASLQLTRSLGVNPIGWQQITLDLNKDGHLLTGLQSVDEPVTEDVDLSLTPLIAIRPSLLGIERQTIRNEASVLGPRKSQTASPSSTDIETVPQTPTMLLNHGTVLQTPTTSVDRGSVYQIPQTFVDHGAVRHTPTMFVDHGNVHETPTTSVDRETAQQSPSVSTQLGNTDQTSSLSTERQNLTLSNVNFYSSTVSQNTPAPALVSVSVDGNYQQASLIPISGTSVMK